jgi:hypothetical protein
MSTIFRAYAQESLTIANAVKIFTLATMEGAQDERPDRVQFQVEDAQIRFTLDGSDPTTTTGLIADVGDLVTIEGITDAKNFKAIRTGSTSAVIQPVYSTKE